MNKEKQIEEMASDFCAIQDMECVKCHLFKNTCHAKKYATRAYNAGYRKIYDDHQRQCTCYALGCQMAEELERKVAREIFEEIDMLIVRRMIPEVAFIDDRLITDIAELKKKYTESEKADGKV